MTFFITVNIPVVISGVVKDLAHAMIPLDSVCCLVGSRRTQSVFVPGNVSFELQDPLPLILTTNINTNSQS